ncbi:hypothetical protein Tsubulata_046969 [Turnera subulata]|uniref:CCHC-type domain-containing protein n=1 Tax=Turnera subulata TaxID=218843 RepID=A0A9Q0G3V9_9ROSI|nr:hypothetical protein Tsubulata_046969 [Turnera subulata]
MANPTLPSVIVEEILEMLPSKSIHRFRQVSKSWSSFLAVLATEKNLPATISDRQKIGDIDHDRWICACGFGYDSVVDDYKVFITTKPAPNGVTWDNPDEETDETGGVFLNIKFSEFRKTIAYTEALTSPYAPLEIKQLQTSVKESGATSTQQYGGEVEATGEKEDMIFLVEDEETENVEVNHSLLCRVLGMKSGNPQAFTGMMKNLWCLAKGIEATQITRTSFLFQFNSGRDVRKIQLCKAPFWVRIYDVPWKARIEQNVLPICRKVGEYVEFDEDGVLGSGSFIRARIRVNVEKPLAKEIVTKRANGSSVRIYFRYERLPNFCYHCGRLGHLLKDCMFINDNDEEAEIGIPYGEWLRASPKKPFRMRSDKGSDKDLGNQTSSLSIASKNAGSPYSQPSVTRTCNAQRKLKFDHGPADEHELQSLTPKNQNILTPGPASNHQYELLESIHKQAVTPSKPTKPHTPGKKRRSLATLDSNLLDNHTHPTNKPI